MRIVSNPHGNLQEHALRLTAQRDLEAAKAAEERRVRDIRTKQEELTLRLRQILFIDVVLEGDEITATIDGVTFYVRGRYLSELGVAIPCPKCHKLMGRQRYVGKWADIGDFLQDPVQQSGHKCDVPGVPIGQESGG